MMPTIDVRDTIKEVIADITLIQQGIGKKAAVRAINNAVDGVATGANREVRKVYNVKARAVAAAMKKVKAGMKSARIAGAVVFSGRNIPLLEFAARPVNPWNVKGRTKRQPGGGVSVKIKVGGARKLVKHAFITTIVSGNNAGKTGVFRRDGERIRFLSSVSIPGMVRSKAVSDALVVIGHTRFKNEFVRQMNLLTVPSRGR